MVTALRPDPWVFYRVPPQGAGKVFRAELPGMVASLKRDPAAWYAPNAITPPHWLQDAAEEELDAPEAAMGAFVYLRENLTGAVGGRARWRTMPWLVLAFGLLIVPPGERLDRVHRHPADRDRHLEHAGADRRGGDADPDSLFGRRTGRQPQLPAPAAQSAVSIGQQHIDALPEL